MHNVTLLLLYDNSIEWQRPTVDPESHFVTEKWHMHVPWLTGFSFYLSLCTSAPVMFSARNLSPKVSHDCTSNILYPKMNVEYW